ncbi:MAG: hypothetical protein MJZ53_01345 [Paludibacteraceae bacterium]|nr:hypothetical protein [Paludibacteraceae bacterium]
MENSITKMSSSDLMLTVLGSCKEHEVKFSGGMNPFTMLVDGEEVYVYIKNLTPAQLSNNNDDIWRIQLPMRDDFEKIKESSSLFLLLGYDSTNKVFTTWNPYWTKQRLNVGKSVSLYSRLSLQQRVSETQEIEQMPLNHDGDVVCIPASLLYEYIKHIRDYYPEETQFVAIGSSINKRKKRAVEQFYHFISNQDNLSVYKEFLKNQGKTESTIRNYVYALLFVYNNNLFARYKSLFSDTTDDIEAVLKSFYHTQEIEAQDIPWHGGIRAALKRFYDCYITIDDQMKNDSPQEIDLFEGQNTEEENKEEFQFDLDEFGKLKSLDDTIKEQLYPYSQDEYPDYEFMMYLTDEYYPDSILSKMTPVDWISLFENTSWKKVPPKKADNLDKKKRQSPRELTILRITYPDGSVVMHKKATDTYLHVFETNYPELINEINFNQLVISPERLPDFKSVKRSQKEVGGYYVSTNFSTEEKAAILKQISDELGLNLTIDIVPKNEATA